MVVTATHTKVAILYIGRLTRLAYFFNKENNMYSGYMYPYYRSWGFGYPTYGVGYPTWGYGGIPGYGSYGGINAIGSAIATNSVVNTGSVIGLTQTATPTVIW
jgi:hypothetical protein